MALKLVNSFARLADAGLSTRSGQILLGMTGNANFTEPTPTVVEFGATLNGYNTALGNSKDGDRVKVAIKNQFRAELLDSLHKWGLYVLLESNGDASKALSSGFNVAQPAQPAPPLAKPTTPVLESGLNPGEIVCRGKKEKGVVVYLHQFATQAQMDANNWNSLPSTKAVAVIQNLQPGTLYYCRLAAVGAKEQLVYSDVVSRIAA